MKPSIVTFYHNKSQVKISTYTIYERSRGISHVVQPLLFLCLNYAYYGKNKRNKSYYEY